MSWRTYKNSSATFFGYEDILLKLYLEIARSGDFKRLIKIGTASEEKCLLVWEQLIKKQEKASGRNQYSSVLQLMKGYASLINDHTILRACLIYLVYAPIRWEVIQVLKTGGYNIDVSSRDNILKSLEAGLRKNENLITKARMKSNELHKILSTKDEEKSIISFEEVFANLNVSLGFNVDDNITLVRYNEYQKIIKAKQKTTEQNGRNKRK